MRTHRSATHTLFPGRTACRAEGAYHSARWKRLSLKIESYAALIIPFSYFIALIFLFNSKFTDMYSDGGYYPLYQGMPDGTITDGDDAGTAKTVLFALVTIALLIFKIIFDFKKAGQTPMDRVMNAVKKEVRLLRCSILRPSPLPVPLTHLLIARPAPSPGGSAEKPRVVTLVGCRLAQGVLEPHEV